MKRENTNIELIDALKLARDAVWLCASRISIQGNVDYKLTGEAAEYVCKRFGLGEDPDD